MSPTGILSAPGETPEDIEEVLTGLTAVLPPYVSIGAHNAESIFALPDLQPQVSIFGLSRALVSFLFRISLQKRLPCELCVRRSVPCVAQLHLPDNADPTREKCWPCQRGGHPCSWCLHTPAIGSIADSLVSRSTSFVIGHVSPARKWLLCGSRVRIAESDRFLSDLRQLLLEFEGLQNTRHLALLNYEAADLNLAGKRFEIASLLNHIHANEPEEVQQEFATADAYVQAANLIDSSVVGPPVHIDLAAYVENARQLVGVHESLPSASSRAAFDSPPDNDDDDDDDDQALVSKMIERKRRFTAQEKGKGRALPEEEGEGEA